MLDIKYIRENLDEVRKATKNKNREVDLDWLLELDGKRRKLMGEIEKLRGKRNINSKSEIRNPKQNSKLQFTIQKDEGKKLKEDIKKLEDELSTIKKEYDGLMLFVPNVPDESVPVGKDSSGNIEIRKWGPVPKRDFTPLDHIALAKKHDLIDFERGAKVAGSRSYFLKNEAALLELAVLTYTFQKLVKKGYIPLIAPSLVKEFTMIGSGQIPWSREEIYHLEKQDIYLSGTAEVPVPAYYS